MFSTLSLVFVITLLTKACGRAPVSTKIVGGTNASAGAWPWQVSLHEGGSHFCGGSLINSEWVLSAAHCFPSNPDPTVYTVYLGRQSQELPNPNEVSRNVSQVIVHPEYNNLSHDNDMALLRLSSPVAFSNYIQPVCLAANGSTFNNDTMWVTGWGDIFSGVSLPSPKVLQEVDVPVVGNTKCNCFYKGSITGNMMCAGTLEGGKDSCQGDSGGPMVIKQGSTWIQAGVVSFGQGCADPNYPGVYARVSNYQNWITQHVGMNNVGFIPFNSTAPVLDETCPTTRTLVSDLLVITSASCIARFMGTKGWSVTLYVVKSGCSRVTANVTKVFTDNGVALLQLSYQFYYNAKLELNLFYSAFGPGTQCSVIGWNAADFTTNLHFQEFQTTIVNCDPSDSTGINICTQFLDVQQVDVAGGEVDPVTYMEQSSRRVPAAVLNGVPTIGLLDGSPSVVPEPPAPADQLLGGRDINLRLLMFEHRGLVPVAYLERA
ncbi:transmembrane protease serine 9-like protein [Labeo rohita]|uniref:Transmembrane protease serine 9-like protein n=1 Tax=Labeo rohita TaxID=84645 RepID=A0A498L530_LABRO|nr:transmembrane protease serine 9-like protein [Labeo rohita]